MKTITAKKLAARLNEVILIDVREPEEYALGYIQSAILIPLMEISLEKIPASNKPIVIYCRSGMRSQEACKILLQQNPNLELYNLEGGILSYQREFNIRVGLI